jgi:hypothetical protein
VAASTITIITSLFNAGVLSSIIFVNHNLLAC